jgi:hypothetical protein
MEIVGLIWKTILLSLFKIRRILASQNQNNHLALPTIIDYLPKEHLESMRRNQNNQMGIEVQKRLIYVKKVKDF